MPAPVTFRTGFVETVRAIREIGLGVRWVRALRRATWVLLFVGLALALGAPGLRGLAVLALTGAAFLLLFDLFAPIMTAWRSRYDNPSARAEQTVAADAAGVHVTAGGTRSFLAWSDVLRVTETPRFLLVYTAAHSATCIPKRAFPDAASLDDFRALATGQAGRPSSPDAGPAGAAGETLGAVRLAVAFRWSTAELFAAARELRRHGSLRWSWVAVSSVALLVALVPVVADLRQGGLEAVAWRRHLLVSGPLLFLATAGRPLVLGWAAWVQTRTSRVARQEQRLVVGELGLRGEGALSLSTVRWDALARAVETRRFFLFFLSAETGVVLPKRVLAPDEVAATRAFLTDKLGFNFLDRT